MNRTPLLCPALVMGALGPPRKCRRSTLRVWDSNAVPFFDYWSIYTSRDGGNK